MRRNKINVSVVIFLRLPSFFLVYSNYYSWKNKQTNKQTNEKQHKTETKQNKTQSLPQCLHNWKTLQREEIPQHHQNIGRF